MKSKKRLRHSLLFGTSMLLSVACSPRNTIEKSSRSQPLKPSTIAVDTSLKPDRPTLPGLPGQPPRPVDKIVDAKGRPSEFVRGELVVTSKDAGAVEALAKRWGGSIMHRSDPTAARDPEAPTSYLVAIDPLKAKGEQLIQDLSTLAPKSRADLRVSSNEGVGTLAAAAKEARAGVTVGVNWLSNSAGLIDRNLSEAPNGPASYTANPTQWSFMRSGGNQDIGVTDAWRALAVAGKLNNRVMVSVIDGGFASNADLPPGSLHVSAWPGKNLDESNDMKGDKWHGTQVSQVLTGVIDNKAGTAGVGAPVVLLETVRSVGDMFTVIVALEMSSPAKIINMSFTVPVPATLSWSVLPLDRKTASMSSNRLLFASSGNDGEDVDGEDCFIGICWEERWYYPCENTGVACIGGLAHDAKSRHPSSNYGGDEVQMYAPFQVFVGADPANPQEGTARWGSGTSFSSPYVAGVAALVWAANPALSKGQVWDIITSTAHAGNDGVVPKYVNARGAVLKALGNVPPMVEIMPTNTSAGSSVGGLPADFRAQVGDLVDETSDMTVTWTSSVDGTLGTGLNLNYSFQTPGPRQITATVRTRRGETASRTIVHTVTMGALTVQITAPTQGAKAYRNQDLLLHADAFGVLQSVPCNKITWKVNRIPSWSAPTCDLKAKLDIVGDATFTATAKLDNGLTGTAQVNVVYSEIAVGKPTITAIDVNPPGGFRVTNFHLRAGITSPAGAVKYQWEVINPADNKPIVIGTAAEVDWQMPQDMRLLCKSLTIEFRLTVTDPAGQTATSNKSVSINFGPC